MKRETAGASVEDQVQARPECTVERALAVIDGKWTTLMLRDLLGGTRRFGELRANLSGISPKTLTDRLRDLERHGVLTRTVYPQIPPRVDYTLTDKGRALGRVVEAMAEWGRDWT
ncbi:winged helix-turn-helix transcriptional regulator [Deinococcus sp.]|uniref:winged helix-turn-helix transcriptional regulator n=1 Tax=Deinococcus sp. TaxID=47478 RepID=UPI003C7E8ADD